MQNRFHRLGFSLIFALSCLSGGSAVADEAGGAAAKAAAVSGGFVHSLQMMQKNFDGEITLLMASFRDNYQAGLWLIGISFLYGLLHAAGPGHGKAIISSYLVANNETLKRGIILAFLSSALQAVTAIILVGLVFMIFTGKDAQAAATRDLEIIGSALIMLLGLRLLWRKTPFLHKRQTAAHHHAAEAQADGHDGHSHTDAGGAHHHGEGECHGHITPPQALKNMNWRQALPLIFSIGIRPCTGALVVMSFALMNGLFALGAVAVFAMSFGTFLVVSALAAIAVNAKKLALRLSNGESARGRLQNILEWAAALFIFFSGLALLLASFYGAD